LSRPRLLIVGGLDPSAGAGLDADRDAARAAGVDAIEVVTARTDQDDLAVRAVGAIDPAEWLAEARAAGRVEALKFGLLPGADAITAAASLAREHSPRTVVVDPVVASSSGHEFLDASSRASLVADLVAAGVILTPNLPEAALLAGVAEADLLASPEARVEAAATLLAAGARAVIVKGGHASENPVRDLLLEPAAPPLWLEHPRVADAHLRGTGCRFATTLAAALAHGRPLPVAAVEAARFVALRLAESRG